jgi:DNA-binding beta-propeller fold protein YncE
MVTTYTADGKPTEPTITGLDGPGGIAVDKNGKIYVTNYYGNSLMTFTASGKPTTPTITTGLGTPFGVAVDASGKDLRDKSQSPRAPDFRGQGRAFHTNDHDVDRTVGCGHPLSSTGTRRQQSRPENVKTRARTDCEVFDGSSRDMSS